MTRNQALALKRALGKRFHGEVQLEPVNGGGRYRFAIKSRAFDGVPHLRRQDEVWSVVDEVLPRDATLDVSLILTFSPADLQEQTAHAGRH